AEDADAEPGEHQADDAPEHASALTQLGAHRRGPLRLRHEPDPLLAVIDHAVRPCGGAVQMLAQLDRMKFGRTPACRDGGRGRLVHGWHAASMSSGPGSRIAPMRPGYAAPAGASWRSRAASKVRATASHEQRERTSASAARVWRERTSARSSSSRHADANPSGSSARRMFSGDETSSPSAPTVVETTG